MKKFAGLLVLCAALVAFASPAYATSFQFTAVINTASLASAAGGPFTLDFQLTGVGPATNTVVLSHFNFGGGGATGSPDLFGGASGTFATGITLNSAGGFFNDFSQSFTPGSFLTFDVLFPAVNVNSPTPDAFAFSILDGSLFPIHTTGFADTLIFVNLSKPLVLADVHTASSITPAGVTATAVPEPATILLLASGLAMSKGVRGRLRKHP